jgi:nucleotide-binding universal stress UspA family protein
MHGINVVEPQYSAIEESLRKAGAEILDDAKKLVNADKVQVETLLKDGHAVKEILDTCKEGQFDLVVMGARGHTLLTHIVESLRLGSVSDNVVHHAPCPVLIVRALQE